MLQTVTTLAVLRAIRQGVNLSGFCAFCSDGVSSLFAFAILKQHERKYHYSPQGFRLLSNTAATRATEQWALDKHQPTAEPQAIDFEPSRHLPPKTNLWRIVKLHRMVARTCCKSPCFLKPPSWAKLSLKTSRQTLIRTRGILGLRCICFNALLNGDNTDLNGSMTVICWNVVLSSCCRPIHILHPKSRGHGRTWVGFECCIL